MIHDERIEREISKLITERMAIDVPSPATDLVATGYLDSLLLAELLAYIERDMLVRIPIEDLDLDEIRTVAGIARLVAQGMSRGAPQGNTR